MKINWKYPQTDYNGLRTWYGILWTIPWYILFSVVLNIYGRWSRCCYRNIPAAILSQRPDV